MGLSLRRFLGTVWSGAFRSLREQRHLLWDSLILGVAGALCAQLFVLMLHGVAWFFLTWIAGYRPPGLPQDGGVLRETVGPHGLWLIPVVTTLGGLISGVLVYTLAPEAEGHGTDAVVKSYHRAGGYLRPRVTPLKMIASAITIGSGGSAGREGPTALITAGVGSMFATLLRRTDEERRYLALIGMAAGLSAVFRSPIGTALFAIEVLYGGMELEAGALLYTLLASVVAYAVNGLFVGWKPLFVVPPEQTTAGLFDFGWYIILGIAAGVTATILPMVFYGVRDAFAKLPIPPHFKPAIGGLGVGLLALWLPQVLGGGYGWIQEAIDGHLALKLLLVLLVAKMIAFTLTVSSGGSGGVFAPTLFVGAMLGGFLGKVFHEPSAAFTVVAMAAVFGGAARVPIATLLMVTEMTGGYQLLVPAALAVTLSFFVQEALSSQLKYKSLYEAQVRGRFDSPAHDQEHLQSLLRLFSERRFAVPASVAHMDLRILLNSGIPVELPDGKQLVMGVLKADSTLVGRTIGNAFPDSGEDDVTVVAVMRGGHPLAPHAELDLRKGDKLLAITSPDGKKRLTEHFEPVLPAKT